MEAFKKKYPVDNELKKQMENVANITPVVNLINGIISLAVDTDVLNMSIFVKLRLCMVLHTASCVKQYASYYWKNHRIICNK